MKPVNKSGRGDAAPRIRRDSGGFQIVETGPTRAVVIYPDLKLPVNNTASLPRRDPEAQLAEAVGLAEALDLEVCEAFIVSVAKPRPATLIGSGKVEELKGAIIARDATLVIVDTALTPVQQRNLERAWDAKVLDRTGLILEIFAARARTREGTLQVELAQLSYQQSRLVRSWTHLERQRGGLGFVGGPGETQMEADRRMIRERITRIEKDIAAVKRTRTLHRKTRRQVPYPVIALVGYTNAGKSTLFNMLTGGGARVADQLFATLDPTMRGLTLPHGRKTIVSDTVGFISDLPTSLIAAFRATLEEVMGADLLLHVRDISHPDSQAQARDVADVLQELGLGKTRDVPIIEVWNKIDLLDPDAAAAIIDRGQRGATPTVGVSAITGAGLPELRDTIETVLSDNMTEIKLTLAATEGAALNWLYENCEVLARNDRDDEIVLTVRAPAEKRDQVARIAGESGSAA